MKFNRSIKSHQRSKIRWFIPENDHFTAIRWGPKTLRHTAILGPCLFCLRAFLLKNLVHSWPKRMQSTQSQLPASCLTIYSEIQHIRTFAPSMSNAFWIVLEDMVFSTLFGPFSRKMLALQAFGWRDYLDSEAPKSFWDWDRLLGCTRGSW